MAGGSCRTIMTCVTFSVCIICGDNKLPPGSFDPGGFVLVTGHGFHPEGSLPDGEHELHIVGGLNLAGLAVGVWESREQVAALWKTDTVFQPRWTEGQRDEQLKQWHRAVLRAMSWAE